MPRPRFICAQKVCKCFFCLSNTVQGELVRLYGHLPCSTFQMVMVITCLAPLQVV
jgi:hypothetical protein